MKTQLTSFDFAQDVILSLSKDYGMRMPASIAGEVSLIILAET